MKKIITYILMAVIVLLSIITNAQVGIGTVTPDSSAVLDLFSTSKGFLLPRFTTSQRDLMIRPATGLQIYNQTESDVQLNTGTPSLPVWSGLKSGSSPSSDTIVRSVTATGDIITLSTIDEYIPGMTLSPPTGSYLVLFSGQYGLSASAPVSTAQGIIDLETAYTQLMAIPATNTTHGPIFGNGETLPPGVYDLPAAVSLSATLTLDGGGDTNSVFIIRMVGAFTTGALTTVVLANGARSRNIFWVGQVAMAMAATTIMKGTMITNAGAISMAASSNLEGRMFSKVGAISMGPGILTRPSGNSYINLGVLSTFVIFTGAGAIANTGASTITGDVGTNAGAIAGFDDIDGNIYGPGAAPNPINNTLVTYSIYQNGILIGNSSRTVDVNTSVVSLQTMATITSGQPIEVWWRVDEGGVILGNRILSLVSVK